MSCHRQLLSLQSAKPAPKNEAGFLHLQLNTIQHGKKVKGRLWLEAFGLVVFAKVCLNVQIEKGQFRREVSQNAA